MAAESDEKSVLPERRIHCSTGKILVGSQEFMSATEALLAYLCQFDGKKRTKQQQDAYDLLVARSKISSRRSRSLNDEVKDAMQEVHRRKMKMMLNKKRSEQTGLRREVEDALTRSAELLDKINDDDSSETRCVSDLGSMSTDLLVSVNPIEIAKKVTLGEDSKHKHVYSYRTDRGRSRAFDRIPLKPQYPAKSAISSRRSSIDSALPASVRKQTKRSSSSSSGAASRHSDPTDILKRYRSRSASPLPSQNTSHWINWDIMKGNGVPSWVDRLDARLDDSVWSQNVASGGRSAPSWVQDVEDGNSVAGSQILGNYGKEVSFNKSGMEKSNLTDSRPGLNFSDLATSRLSKHSDQQSFLSSHKIIDSVPRDYAPPSSAGFKYYSAASNSTNDTSPDLLSQSGFLETSLDRYLERMEAETLRNSKHKYDDVVHKPPPVPKCSSMEIESHALPRSDITGASTIPRDSNVTPVVTGEDPSFTPARVRFSPNKADIIPPSPLSNAAHSPGTDVLLEGDRPWEKTTGAYKPPVYVDETKIAEALRSDKKTPSPTLTGSDQPGSMEALKNMLFRLQAEESTSAGLEDPKLVGKSMNNPLDLPALKDYNFQAEPGGQSLEKALVHLSRLKTLVNKNPSDSASTISVSTSLTATSALSS